MIMKPQNRWQSLADLARRKPIWLAAALLAGVVIAAFAWQSVRPKPVEMVFHEVKRGDFLISIVEGGTLEAVNAVVIRSEVEGTARIIFIVPEGTAVKKGDLLVELDSSASQDAVNLQQINVEKAQFALIQAEQQLEIQKSSVESEISAAQLKVEFAASDLEKFEKGEAAQLLRNAQIEITNVMETLKIAEERLAWSEKLFAKGFETKANLDKDRLSVSQTSLKLEQARKALWMLETFDNPKKKRELEAALQEARENLDRVKLQGERKLAQYKADVDTQKSTLDLSKRKLERDLKQLAATKIFAPQDGMVVYASASSHFSSESMIEEGAVVRYRQELIRLPDISDMKLTVKIHESHINQIRRGQPAYVVLDAMPDKRFGGTVSKVAPLPDTQSRWGNPNLKVYATEILITDPLPNVKPGVSARAEIIITNLPGVLTVPIQCVTTRRGQQVVYLADAPQQPVPVQVGYYNVKFIEIVSGLKEGDRVLLNPPFDTQSKDLAGGIMAEGEKAPAPAANASGRLSAGAPAANGERADTEPRGKRDAVGGAGAAERGPDPGGSRPTREEMLKRFDKNGDGELDDNERAAMREQFGKGRRSSTNAPAAPAP